MASSDDDEDYNGNLYDDSGGRQFPLHDACEFGEIDNLRVRPMVGQAADGSEDPMVV